MSYVLRSKCLIVGDSTVGKSAIAAAFHSDGIQFVKTYNMTTGCEILLKMVPIPESEAKIEFFLVDCSGKDLYSDFIQKQWDMASMAVLVFDITNAASFENCKKWLERLRPIKSKAPFPIALVANKTDLSERRQVQSHVSEQFAKQNDLAYFECCAREIHDVEKPFQYLAKKFSSIYEAKLNKFASLV